MRATLIVLVSVVVIAAMILIAVTIALYSVFKPNTRVFLVDNIFLMTRIDDGQARYGAVEIGNPGDPYCGTLGLSFRCGEEKIALDEATVDLLVHKASRVASANHESVTRGRWPDDAKRLDLCHSCVRIVVSEDEILQVAMREGEDAIQFRTSRSTSWFSFPLTDADAETLFGTPDQVHDFFRH